MTKEIFEKHIKSRMEALDELSEDSIFHALKGTIEDANYEEKTLTMRFYVSDFHKNNFNIMFGGSLVGMFDIAFGTLTAALGDYSVAPTVQLSTSFLKGIPMGVFVDVKVEAVSVGKTLMNFVGKAYVEDDLVGTATGIFKTPRPFKPMA